MESVEGIVTAMAEPYHLPPTSHATFGGALIDALPQPAAVLSVDFFVCAANQLFRDNFTKNVSNPVGKPISALGHELWDNPEIRHALQLADPRQPRRTAASTDVELPDSRVMTATFNPLDVSGEPLLLVLFEDITERRNREQQFHSAQRRKDQFLMTLAHELRNPLAAIDVAVRLLQNEGAEPHRPWAQDVISRQVFNLSRLLDDLTEVSRISCGKIEIQHKPLVIGPLLFRAAESTRPLFQERDQTLEVDITGEPLHVDADPMRLEQVFVNLLNNASKYSENGGHIMLRACRVGDTAAITVRDNGRGIPSEAIPHIFDLFMQLDETGQHARGGLGVGLTIVRRLVQLHDGTISVQSPGPGKGSEFTVRLPLRPDAHEPVDAEPRSTALVTGEHERILVIEDEPDLAEGILKLFCSWGHEVRAAFNGAMGLREARFFQPTIVILDLGLPDINGYEVARTLRAIPGLADVLIAAVSGFGDEEAVNRCRQEGCNCHLVKPLNIAALSELLQKHRRDLAEAAQQPAPH